MNKALDMPCEYGFGNDSKSSYLVLKFNDGVRLLSHQIEIICQNPSTAFIPFHLQRENEDIRLYYNITSKISLSQYLERKRLTRRELLDLLKSITKALMQYSNYLLQLSGFVINPDFIYLNPATAEVSLVYLPVPQEKDAIELYRSFLKELMVNTASIDDSAKDNYLQRILNYLKNDSFNLNSFCRLVTELGCSGEPSEAVSGSISVSSEPVFKNEIPDRKTRVTAPSNECKEKASGHIKIIMTVLLQLLFVFAAAIIILFMLYKKAGDLFSGCGVLLIAAAIDLLVTKRITGKAGGLGLVEKAGLKAENRHRYFVPKNRDKENVQDSKAFETMFVSDNSKESHPYIESIGGNTIERAVINKDRFVIGRLSSMVDYAIPGSTVGKLHAEIIFNNGIYAIRDLNSKNGTYVNDIRIPSNKEYEIKPNDIIRFADQEYSFRHKDLA